MESQVANIGYIVITAADPDAWGRFASSTLGLQVVPAPAAPPATETVYLRMDERSWRIGVEKGTDGGVAALGFEVADRPRFEALRQHLTEAGVAVKDAPEVAAQRDVVALFQAEDPAGHPLEFFYGLRIPQANFVSPCGAKFVTGAQGFGHAFAMGGDSDEMYEFYVNVLGFRLSDVIKLGPVLGYFTSPNPRHHTIAFAGGMPGMPSGVQHIMLQVDDLDTVGRALDRVYDDDTVALQSGLGKHTNDHMISFYCISPSGLAIEYGWAGREIDNSTHTTGHYDAASFWGHRLPDGRDPMKAMMEAMMEGGPAGQ